MFKKRIELTPGLLAGCVEKVGGHAHSEVLEVHLVGAAVSGHTLQEVHHEAQRAHVGGRQQVAGQ